METVDWADRFGAAITVVDRDLAVVYMNDRAGAVFEKWGGRGLLGKSLASCHTDGSMEIMRRILETGEPHTYTIEKAGPAGRVRKIIHQAPWEKDGATAGLVEISFEIPWEMGHYVRG
jgi:transcriptional regulator with PAS, ATPase and Fis domain